MSCDVYAVHFYGIETGSLCKYKIKDRIQDKIETWHKTKEIDLFECLYENTLQDIINPGIVSIFPSGDGLYGIGFPIVAPWDMPVKDQGQMNIRIQDLLEQIYEDIPQDFVENYAGEIFYPYYE